MQNFIVNGYKTVIVDMDEVRTGDMVLKLQVSAIDDHIGNIEAAAFAALGCDGFELISFMRL